MPAVSWKAGSVPAASSASSGSVTIPTLRESASTYSSSSGTSRKFTGTAQAPSFWIARKVSTNSIRLYIRSAT